jgi:hypothetical protein
MLIMFVGLRMDEFPGTRLLPLEAGADGWPDRIFHKTVVVGHAALSSPPRDDVLLHERRAF